MPPLLLGPRPARRRPVLVRTAEANHRLARSRPQAALDARHVQDPARDLLDRRLRRVELRDTVALENRVGRSDLVLHLLRRRVAALRPTLLANLPQALGLD